MDNRLIVILIVAILAVASVGTLFMLGQSDSKGQEVKPTGRLVAYGNANNDDYLDERDLDLIKDIANGDKEWDKTANSFADVNVDGDIDSEDVEHLEKILNKEKCKMYYLDVWGGISSIKYPITGSLGTMYWEQADMAILLGVWDRVEACGSGSMKDFANPGWRDKTSIGNGYNAEPELILSTGVDAFLAYTQKDGTALQLKELIEKTGSEMDLLAPPITDKVAAVITYGVLLSCEERAYEYATECDKVIEYMNEKLSGYTEETAPTVIVCQVRATSNVGDILVLGPATLSSANGWYTYMEMTPSKVILPDPYQDFYTSVTAEWIDSHDPDYILFTGPYGGLTEEEAQAKFEEKAEELFGGTRAYEENHIISAAGSTLHSNFFAFGYLKVLAQIYDEIDEGYADEVWNLWFERGYCYYEPEEMPSLNVRTLADT